MCTAIYTTDTEGGVWLARTLDADRDYGEAGVMTPRGYLKGRDNKYGELSMIGTASIKNGMPLYFEAVNEHGVGVAALNFTKSAAYVIRPHHHIQIAVHEFIPYLLSHSRTLAELKRTVRSIGISSAAPEGYASAAKLHFMAADATGACVIEPLEGGIRVEDCPIPVLTNEPPYQWHISNARFHSRISAGCGVYPFEGAGMLPPSFGCDAAGLGGSFDSKDRFIKAAYVLFSSSEYIHGVGDVFRILDTVSVPRGSVRSPDGPLGTSYSSALSLTDASYFISTASVRNIFRGTITKTGEGLATFPFPPCSEPSYMKFRI